MNNQKTTPLRERMREDLRLRNLSPHTEKSYIGHIARFAKHFGKSPESLGILEVRQYLQMLREKHHVELSHYKQAVSALRFLYCVTLKREWLKEEIPYPKSKTKLPVVLSRQEVSTLLSKVREQKYQVCLKVLYGAGLRITEALSLKVADIDSKRMLIHIRRGKGGRPRAVMLSPELLNTLREYYLKYKPHVYLFETKTKKQLHQTAIQKVCNFAAKEAGITDKRVYPHALRHSFATHLLEQGTDIRIIQELLGHTSIQSTLVYTHVAAEFYKKIQGPLDALSAV